MAKKKKITKTPVVGEEKSNENKDLTTLDKAEALLVDFLRQQTLRNADRYYILRTVGISAQRAAAACGYSDTYCYRLDAKLKNDQNVATRVGRIIKSIPSQYQSLCRLRLIPLAEAENKAIQQYIANPDLLIDKPQLAKQIKQTSGVLADDGIQSPTFINIQRIQNMLLAPHQDGIPALPEHEEDVIEIEDETDSEKR
ncbi:MAG: hypothetical protein JSW07_14720 [bacterium]|nr:MAG: hypothetical protein JSW07_14720 [bacterium]